MSDYDEGYDEGYREGIQVAKIGQRRIEELEAKLELIKEEWAGAVYGDLENGVASLNAAAATDFCKRYPLVSSFEETLVRIIYDE